MTYGPHNPEATYVTHDYPEHGFDTGEVMLNYAMTGSPGEPRLAAHPGTGGVLVGL